MQKHFFYLLLILASILSSPTYAIKAYPHPITITQADGSSLIIRLHGDEFFRYRTTEDGFLIKKDDAGIYRFATHDKLGNVAPSKIKARNIGERTILERTFAASLERNPNFIATNTARRAQKLAKSSTAIQTAFPLTGSPRSIAILVNFKDKSFVTANPKQAFERMLNQQGYSDNGGTGSARDYFIESSFGAFSPQFDVVGPFDLPQNMAFYGANDSQDEDQNPRQMIIDACKAAEAAGVDFKIFDTDNDGILDNVFVFYAGYNEAEGGPDDTVWPHRWSLSNLSSTVSGKIIFDYACTSELRGRSGNPATPTMAGIGTFTHEFGHVLGLPDYYPTNGASHYTTGNWHIMDGGAYNNSGRTPPTYSAYDRFYLNWLVPIELKTPQNVVLNNLIESNQAYILTQNGNHNLVGNNPIPAEFFVLENRQKNGFDAYLPGKGMLITRIFYNSTTWRNNGPNNSASALGYDIIEADGIASDASQAGDPFPGSTNKTFYNPTLRNGTNINKALTEIAEVNGQIRFKLMGGTQGPSINVLAQTLAFEQSLGADAIVRSINVSATNLTHKLEIVLIENNAFDIKLANGTEWVKSIEIIPTDAAVNTTLNVRFNASVAGVQNNQLGFASVGATDVFVPLAGLCIDPTAPILRPGLVAEQLKFPLTVQGSTSVKTLSIKTTDVMGNLSVVISGTNANMFSVSAASITKEQANNGYLLTVSYKPTTAAPHQATLTISGGGLPQAKVIELLGE